MLTVTLTEEVKKLPYFSSFTEKEVEIPQYFYFNELVSKTLEPTNLSIEQLKLAIFTCSYFALTSTLLLEELLWKIGESKDLFHTLFDKDSKLHVTIEEPLRSELYQYIGNIQLDHLKHGIRFDCPGELGEIARYGNLRLYKWAELNGRNFGRDVYASAAQNGHLNILQWIRANGKEWNPNESYYLSCLHDCTFDFIRSKDSVNYFPQVCSGFNSLNKGAVNLFKEKSSSWDASICGNAAYGGHLEILKWAKLNNCKLEEDRIWLHAARNGHLHILKWCVENNMKWREQVASDAALNGHLEILQWILEIGRTFDIGTCYNAAYGNHFDLLKWSSLHVTEWYDMNLCEVAARTGNLEMVQWLRSKGCGWTSMVCPNAARGGYLDLLKWAKENGCIWDVEICSEVCFSAANNGHLEVLRWVRENSDVNFRTDSNLCMGAVCGDQLNILKWAVTVDCKWDAKICDYAASSGNLEIVQWLRDQGCEWTVDFCSNAAAAGQLNLLQWARENHCPWSSKVCKEAARRGYIDILKWAVLNDCECDSVDCFMIAKTWNNTDITIWLEQQFGKQTPVVKPNATEEESWQLFFYRHATLTSV